jgi:hypothetical protein
MRLRNLSILILAAALLTACSTLTPTQHTLTVTGHGEVSLQPDVASITLGVQTRRPDVAGAVSENNRVAAAILEAARRVGVADADMQTSYFSVYSQPEYDEFGVLTSEVTYWVDNNLTVRLRDVSRLSQLLQAAVDAGATTIYGVEFTVAETGASEDEARQQAIADAHERARQIAASAGLTLGEVLTISTGITAPPPVFYGAEAIGIGGGGGPPIASGSTKVSADVTITYLVR